MVTLVIGNRKGAKRRGKDDPPPPSRPNTRELAELILAWERTRGPASYLVPLYARDKPSNAAALAIHQTVPQVVRALIERPAAAGDLIAEASAIRSETPELQQFGVIDRAAVKDFQTALTPSPPHSCLYWLKRALDHVLTQRLTSGEAAALMQWLSERSVGTLKSKRHAQAPDVSTARLKIISECAAVLNDDDQQQMAELMAAMANQDTKPPRAAEGGHP